MTSVHKKPITYKKRATGVKYLSSSEDEGTTSLSVATKSNPTNLNEPKTLSSDSSTTKSEIIDRELEVGVSDFVPDISTDLQESEQIDWEVVVANSVDHEPFHTEEKCSMIVHYEQVTKSNVDLCNDGCNDQGNHNGMVNIPTLAEPTKSGYQNSKQVFNPEAFKQNFFWPVAYKKKQSNQNKGQKEKLTSVMSSEEWRDFQRKKNDEMLKREADKATRKVEREKKKIEKAKIAEEKLKIKHMKKAAAMEIKEIKDKLRQLSKPKEVL